MNPIFININTDGTVYVSNDVTFAPKGKTLLQQFRVNPNGISQLLCTLTGSGNASASALAVAAATKSGKAEGNEVH
jgi:hypothetical protein